MKTINLNTIEDVEPYRDHETKTFRFAEHVKINFGWSIKAGRSCPWTRARERQGK